MHIIWVLVIGVVAGWLAGVITKGRGFGLVGDLVVGVLGALLGGFVFGLLGIEAWGIVGRLLVAIVGAVLFLYLLRFIRRI